MWVLHRPTELWYLFKDKLCYDFVLPEQIIQGYSQQMGLWTRGRRQSCWMMLTWQKHSSQCMKWEPDWGTWLISVFETICCWYWIFRCGVWYWFEDIRIVWTIVWMLCHTQKHLYWLLVFLPEKLQDDMGHLLIFVLPQLAAASAALICCKVL